ncbi:peptidyl-prolyl cis-trans isomerase [Malikia spinosa]|uniref:Peptidyl-prolyl cis-trans isomerase n=1 Tax=Malikia spinosa TaxID=86180 RepID=A0A2S9KHV3_9BURK|nr:peptidyl-prolyl cis-trans isomerase [Malikia spinosa]PRD70014.1 peptidyl-prolyl cis-trans isomerase [Malikia spinosa]
MKSTSVNSIRLQTALREPLLHFLILGAAIFGVDQWRNAGSETASDIVVTAKVQQEAKAIFEAGMKREPKPEELKVLLDRWVDNEILYREGLQLGLDRGDSGIRDRVIFKAMSVTQAGIVLPEVDEAGLKAWFESNRERYDTPARFDFLEAAVPPDTKLDALQRFAVALNSNQDEPGIESSLRVFRDRPRSNLLQSYGKDFTEAIEQLKPGQWQVLVSNDGPRVIRLESLKPAVAADFEAVKVKLYQDWKDEMTSQRSKELIREMGKKYQIRQESLPS